MFEQFISAMPVKMEQRFSEEEELARQLKREAAIFFPDRRADNPADAGQEPEALREGESDYEARNTSYSKAGGRLGEGESEYEGVSPAGRAVQGPLTGLSAVVGEIGTERETEQIGPEAAEKMADSRWAEGIRLAAVLDKPRALKPWGEEGF